MAVLKPIRTEYADGMVTITNVRSKLDGTTVSYTVVNQWHDGTAMSDAKIDTFGIFTKYKPTGEYLRQNLPNWGENFLEINTVAEFRNLSAYNLALLRFGYYKGIRLNGYYTQGDTPGSIDYFISTTSASDDGGSVLVVSGTKFEHKFTDSIECKYFGIFNNVYNPLVISGIIEYAYNNKIKDVILTSDISINIPATYDGIGIVMKSNVNFHLRGQISVVPNNNDRYRVLSLTNASNIILFGYPTGGIIGDVEGHTGTSGEWGNGIYIGDGCSNISIEYVNITKCWGDGIYIGGFQSNENYSSDIKIFKNNISLNRRQGISIAKGRNITINGNLIKDTGVIRGTFPMDGIDIEPNVNNEINNVKIFDNSFVNNKGYDFQIYCNTNNSKVSNIRFHKNDIENSQAKFNSTINTLISISGRRLDPTVFPEDIIINDNTIDISDVTHLTSVLYSYGSTKNIQIHGNTISSSSNLNTFRFDTTSDIKISKNSHDKIANYIILTTQCDGVTIVDNVINSIQDVFLNANSSSNIDIVNNVISNQTGGSNRVISCGNINGIRVINNDFSNTKRGVFICTSTINNFIFKLNNILEFNTSAIVNEPAVYITAATANSANNIISNNTIVQTNNAVSYGIRASRVSPNTMTNTIIKDNELLGTYSTRISNEVGVAVLVSDKNIIQEATSNNSGLVKSSANVQDVNSANATDLPTALALVNELKNKLNAKLVADRASGQQSNI